MDTIQQIKNEEDFLFLNWKITNGCNYKCTYCDSNIVNKDYWLSENKKIVLTKLNTIKKKFKICICGGEPSMHPDMPEIVNEISKIESLDELILNTNFSKSGEYFQQFSGVRNLVVAPSYHPEYHNNAFFRKCLELKDVVSLRVTVMLSDKPEYWEQTHEAINFFVSNDIPFLVLLIVSTDTYKINYTEEFYTQFKQYLNKSAIKDLLIVTDTGSYTMSFIELQHKGLNAFKDYNCTAKVYNIGNDGNFYHDCTNNKAFMLTDKVLSEQLKCPLDMCLEDIKYYGEKFK